MRVTDLSRRFPTHIERDFGSNASGPGTVPTDAAVVTRWVAGSITATAWLSSESGLASEESSPPETTAKSSVARPTTTATAASTQRGRWGRSSGPESTSVSRTGVAGSRAGSWARTLACNSRSLAPGSTPSSSTSTLRASW